MNDDLISRQRLLKGLKHRQELFYRNRIEFLGPSKNDKARVDEIDNCYAMVINAPSAQPEHMHTVMLKIKEKYEKAMNTPCINNPIAWALYQTWKEYDR